MNFQQIIKRRIRLGKSFCSYTFKSVYSSNKSFIVNAQRHPKYLQKNSYLCSTAIASTKSVSLQSSRFKSISKRSQNFQNKINTQNRQSKKKVNYYETKFESESQIKNNFSIHGKNNKMQEYLSDYFDLKDGDYLKVTKFENIPSALRNSIKNQNQKIKNNERKIIKITNFQKNFKNNVNQNLMQISQLDELKHYNTKDFPQFFYDFSLYQNKKQLPFKIFRILNINNKMYIQKQVNESLFGSLPIKKCYQRLNNFATKLQENIFYIVLSKQKDEFDELPYSQSFFWISKPIKHNDRQKILILIKKFIHQCLVILNQDMNRMIGPKIWIIDYGGRISFINKSKIAEQFRELQKQNVKKQGQVCKKDINEICLSMFLASMNRGFFNNESTISQKQKSNEIKCFDIV